MLGDDGNKSRLSDNVMESVVDMEWKEYIVEYISGCIISYLFVHPSKRIEPSRKILNLRHGQIL